MAEVDEHRLKRERQISERSYGERETVRLRVGEPELRKESSIAAVEDRDIMLTHALSDDEKT